METLFRMSDLEVRFNLNLNTLIDGRTPKVCSMKEVLRAFGTLEQEISESNGVTAIQNENFIHLLENFSSANQPAGPLSGQIWFDNSLKKLKFYDGTKFRTTGGAEISTTQPVGLTTGDFWWDTTNNQLYVYNGTIFVLIGPQNAGDGITQMQSLQLLDTNGTTRNVIAGTLNSETVMLISAVEFDIATSNAITGFD